ncbi:hypothetical protein BC830DRAFT_1166299 [Chytriomyces sp. MP71]|nr:hypothetical protein BC830DRAFT_1166299 [Chytriomyces sp. MP71]
MARGTSDEAILYFARVLSRRGWSLAPGASRSHFRHNDENAPSPYYIIEVALLGGSESRSPGHIPPHFKGPNTSSLAFDNMRLLLHCTLCTQLGVPRVHPYIDRLQHWRPASKNEYPKLGGVAKMCWEARWLSTLEADAWEEKGLGLRDANDLLCLA